MYYLAKQRGPVPAEAPYTANADERFHWDTHQRKHRERLRNVTGTVDKSLMFLNGPVDGDLLRVQAQTRKFHDDLRKADIGRENRKLVDRLGQIAKGCTAHHGGPPPVPGAQPGQRGATTAALAQGPTGAALAERARSVNDAVRRWKRRQIEQDNASLVHRILGVKSTFDAHADAKDFERHKRFSDNMRRLPEKKMKRDGSRPRSLPPLRPPRPGRDGAKARGLEDLLLPVDLQRIGRPPLPPGASHSQELQQSASAPETSREGAMTWTGHISTDKEEAASERASPSRSPRRNSRGEAAVDNRFANRWPTEEAAPALQPRSQEDEQRWTQRDEATERRAWVSGEISQPATSKDEKVGLAGASQPFKDMKEEMAAMGVSTGSIGYSEHWDEASFSTTTPSVTGSFAAGTTRRLPP
mmetsp:Transcript_7523/g.13560  ORF Transcript_7523/g.13560 Transcript_7523/m.13560 type:complete len:414 (-) Transcript_7523:147-1388(-)